MWEEKEERQKQENKIKKNKNKGETIREISEREREGGG